MKIRALSVSELNKYIRRMITNDPILNHIILKGEVSNLKYHGSGHLYFSLKDKQSKINCVMFKDKTSELKFEVINGMSIIVKGYVSIFERDGQYQLYVNEIQPDGIGMLTLAFEQLKSKLEKEGIFDFDHKKSIPLFPKKIAVVTSPTGAAIRDILSVAQRRNPCVDMVLYPVLVQGERASMEIASAIEKINQNPGKIDLIILSRGGGSIEELWAFNEEIVARSIYHSKIPIISAVGHETDYTIADFAADIRAATPSAASELAVPRMSDIQATLEHLLNKMNLFISKVLRDKRDQMQTFNQNILHQCVSDRLKEEHQMLEILQKDIQNNIRVKLETCRGKMLSCISKLEAINPLSTIARGYAMVWGIDHNRPIDTVNKINVEDKINIMLTDGCLSCRVVGKTKEDKLLEQFRGFKVTKE
jgi:exodeoxyribonuclease VII large subunit